MAVEYTGPGGIGSRSIEVPQPLYVARRVAWGALFAGTVAAFALQLLFTVLGMAIGLSIADAAVTNRDAPGEGAGIAAGLWLLLSGIVSLFVGGCVAGRLAAICRSGDGLLHGFLTWGLTALIGAWAVTSSLSSVVGGTASIASDTAAALSGKTDLQFTDGDSNLGPSQSQFWSDVENEVERYTEGVAETTAPDDESGEREIMDAARIAFQPGVRRIDPADRTRLIIALETHADMPRVQAGRTVDRWEREWAGSPREARTVADSVDREQTRQRALQMADTAASYVAGVSWWTFASLLLGAVAASLGGWTSIHRENPAARTS